MESAFSLSSVLDETTIYVIDKDDDPLARPESILPPIIAQTLPIAWVPAHEYIKFPMEEHMMKKTMGHFNEHPKYATVGPTRMDTKNWMAAGNSWVTLR